jgi:hypothetical protein
MIEVKNNRIAKRILKSMNKDIYEFLKQFNGFISGGAVLSAFTNKQINDYDLYFYRKEDADLFIMSLDLKDDKSDWTKFSKRESIIKKSRHNNIEIFRTENAITFLSKEQKYQVITAFYLAPELLFEKYDFTVCMAAYNPLHNKFTLHNTFLEDVSEKRLKFNIGTEYPICSLLRTIKYQKKGYTINGLEFIKIALTIHNLNLKDYSQLKKQLQGIDTLFLADLTAALTSDEFKTKKFKDYNNNPEE